MLCVTRKRADLDLDFGPKAKGHLLTLYAIDSQIINPDLWFISSGFAFNAEFLALRQKQCLWGCAFVSSHLVERPDILETLTTVTTIKAKVCTRFVTGRVGCKGRDKPP